MSKKLLISFLFFFQIGILITSAQSNTAFLLTDSTPIYHLLVENPSFDQRITKDYVDGASYFKLDAAVLNQLRVDRPAQWLLKLPQEDGTTLKVLLHRKHILSENFKVTTPEKREEYDYSPGLYYQGRVMGNSKSIVAISVFNDWLMGVLTTQESTYVLGHLYPDSYPTGKDYILYKENDLLITNKFACGTNELDQEINDDTFSGESHTKNGNNKSVKVYFEADYHMFIEKGSNATNTTDYVTGLFNVVNALYEAESIIAEISEIFVWTQDDPYPNNSNALTTFRNRLNGNYNGDLAHLVTRDPGGNGGVAYVDVLCEDFYGVAYSNVNSGYNNNPVPTYSWTTMVVTHEMGHNLGSPHTQSCTWPGGAIDNCVATENGFCERGPAPTSGGTIMSYCHQSQYGINFNNGFGPLPGNLIRREVDNARCLTAPSNNGNGNNEEEDDTPKINLLSAGFDDFSVSDDILQINHYVYNNGTEAATDYLVVYFLTKDERFDITDPIIGTRAVPGTSANALSDYYKYNVDLTTLQVENGTYYVGYFIDSDEEIVESNEFDNGTYWLEQVTLDNPLAVSLTRFTATTQDHHNVISWETTNETATAKFHVQRSLNGKDGFKTIQTVDAAGYSNNRQNYTVLDKQPTKTAFYRLETENQDGSWEYSSLVLVERNTVQELIAQPFFPNPAQDYLYVQFSSPTNLKTSISLMDLTGRLVRNTLLVTGDEINTQQISVGALAAGIYLVRIENTAGVITQKIVIK